MKVNIKSLTNSIYVILGCGIICFVLFRFCSTFAIQLRLKLYGERTKAVVKKVWIYKAYPHAQYEFNVNGKLYLGDKGYFPVDIAVDDSICINYLPNNPKINMASKD